ncbi:uncharacterized protein LOC120343269 [Styela clava]
MNLKVEILLAASLIAVCYGDSCRNIGCRTFDLTAFDCQCNRKCIYYGNCCSDYSALCDTAASCRGQKCDDASAHDHDRPCQCNEHCFEHNDCCPDYPEACDVVDALHFF